jgi:hypothetical protein
VIPRDLVGATPVDSVDYSSSVYINAPFDNHYVVFLRAITFAVLDLGYLPRCALESGNSQPRILKLLQLLRDCRYSIHDISFAGPDRDERLPRFNMAFELGMFVACREFGVDVHRLKEFLVLDTEASRYRDTISDLAGYDIQNHSGSPELAILEIRKWLSTASPSTLPSGAEVIKRFSRFCRHLPKVCAKLRLDVHELTWRDFTHVVRAWLVEDRRRCLARKVAKRDDAAAS